jgi:hypothetical protein
VVASEKKVGSHQVMKMGDGNVLCLCVPASAAAATAAAAGERRKFEGNKRACGTLTACCRVSQPAHEREQERKRTITKMFEAASIFALNS